MDKQRVGRGVIHNMSLHALVVQRVFRVARSIRSFPAHSFHICKFLLIFEMLLKSMTLPETLRKGVEALVAFNVATGMWVSWIQTEPSPRPMKVM